MSESEKVDNGVDTTSANQATGEGMPEPPGPDDAGASPPAVESLVEEGVPASSHVPPPSIADDTTRHLDERYIEFSRTIGAIVTIVFAAVDLIGGVFIPAISGAPGWVVALLALGGGIVTTLVWYVFHRWPAFEHPYHFYRLNPRGIEIHHGVWFRSIVNVARSRIQHTDVSQGPIERRFGLATIHIHTAGTDEAEVSLPGLEHAMALAIRDYLVTGGEDDAV